MKRRILFGAVLIAALLGLMWLDHALTAVAAPAWAGVLRSGGGTWIAGAVLLVVGVLAAARAGFELARMFEALGVQVSRKTMPVCGAAGMLAGALAIGHEPLAGAWSGNILATAAGLAVYLSMLAYIRDRDVKGAGTAVSAATLSFVYCGVLLGFLLALRREHSIGAMLAVVFTVKACDSGAYFTGSAIGRRKLIPWLSPGKTWEGLIGGLVWAAGFGVLFAWLSREYGGLAGGLRLAWWQGAVFGAVLGLLGQAGDLAASVFKRDAGIKDAGRILPGFGGLIDMLDSLLLTAPAAFWILAMLAR